MNEELIAAELKFPVEFYDVDSMSVVWHGNYVKYMEKARCALLDKIGFGYLVMVKEGYVFPVVDLKIKYIRSLKFGETARIIATLVEYENRIKIRYQLYNDATGELATKMESTQMAVKKDTGETMFVCPDALINKVKKIVSETQHQ